MHVATSSSALRTTGGEYNNGLCCFCVCNSFSRYRASLAYTARRKNVSAVLATCQSGTSAMLSSEVKCCCS